MVLLGIAAVCGFDTRRRRHSTCEVSFWSLVSRSGIIHYLATVS
jgi:hypothetical protein